MSQDTANKDTAAANPTNQSNQQQRQGQLIIQNIYAKDISFETPNSPQIFLEMGQTQPQMEHQFSHQLRVVAENVYEVNLSVTVTVKIKEKTAFLVEVTQAGIFVMSGFNKEQVNFLANTFCLNTLFPYLRESVSSLVVRGGFPIFLLPPINFEAKFMQENPQAAQQAVAAQQPPPTQQ